MKVELQSSTMKAQTLEAGQFVESMLTSERNGKWNEKDVTKEIYNILNEDMIVACSWFSNLSNCQTRKYFWKYYINICTFFIF